ncbi:hypothetical protein [Croceitalea sp. P059]|uniref:hypothetical protein n=1 Tax=Croceitalea sp. P059 TaxID=3075601 RepID=UPI0028841B77|nr:hypothetical protein [Croceitalea sp. P059]MDT0539817.1 hypothetical protein [Croceitalea sp. P059]
MKKFLKVTGIIIGLGLLLLILFGWIKSESLPEGSKSQEADLLANKMLTALNIEAYKNTRFLEWTFRNGANQFVWDKELGICVVKWDTYEVRLNLNNTSQNKVIENGVAINTNDKQKLIKKALSYFNNDSFWLVAPYKIFDKGTERSIVDLEDGSKGLLITYTTGGDTPGDSYLWLLNKNGFPNSYKMWVSVIPIGGLKASWDDWIITESGAFLPKTHEFGPLTMDMGSVKGYNE